MESVKDKSQNVRMISLADDSQDDAVTNTGLYIQIRNKLIQMLKLNVLKDPIFFNICLGQSFVNFSDITFFILQPMLLFQYEYDKAQVATCISICAGADVTGRCLLAVLSNIVNINTRILYYMATLFTLIMRIVILQITDFLEVAVVTAVLGILRAWLHVASPLVISNHVTHEDFPGAYAVFMLAVGVVNVVCSPLIGLLKDTYQDYTPAFYVLTLCCIPCLCLWPVEYFFKKK